MNTAPDLHKLRVGITRGNTGYSLDLYAPTWRQKLQPPLHALCALTRHRIEYTGWYLALVSWCYPRTTVAAIPIPDDLADFLAPDFTASIRESLTCKQPPHTNTNGHNMTTTTRKQQINHDELCALTRTQQMLHVLTNGHEQLHIEEAWPGLIRVVTGHSSRHGSLIGRDVYEALGYRIERSSDPTIIPTTLGSSITVAGITCTLEDHSAKPWAAGTDHTVHAYLTAAVVQDLADTAGGFEHIDTNRGDDDRSGQE